MNFDVLNDKFKNIEIIRNENCFDKVRTATSELCDLLNFFKNNAEFDFDRLNAIIAVDLYDKEELFELIYDLYSTQTAQNCRVSILVDRNSSNAPSVVEIYKSAYYDECEIFDLFGINFINNPNLKRLLMPKGWIGHPMRKDYVFEDKRLEWGQKNA